MLGQLPTTLEISGKKYEIRTDFRNVLSIISAFNDDELQDNEKIYICLKRLLIDFDSLPTELYAYARLAEISSSDRL